MREICEDLKERSPEIVDTFRQLARTRRWIDLPEKDPVDDLIDVVVGLVEASICEPHDVDTHRRKVHAAVSHGRTRRREGYPEDLLFREYELLRESIWTYVRKRFGASGRATHAIMRIDAAMTVATRASLLGFNHEAYGSRLPTMVERLAASSPLLLGLDEDSDPRPAPGAGA